MEKMYIKAEYRIPGKAYSDGYICIDEYGTRAIFSLDMASIQIKDDTFYLYLKEFNPDSFEYFHIKTFSCPISSNELTYPCSYILQAQLSNTNIELKLINKITNLHSIPGIEKDFLEFFGY